MTRTISSFSSTFARCTLAAVLDQLLQRIKQEQKNGNVYANCIDLTCCYHLLIVAWVSTGGSGGGGGVGGGRGSEPHLTDVQCAEDVLDTLQDISKSFDGDDPLLCGPTASFCMPMPDVPITPCILGQVVGMATCPMHSRDT